MKPYDAKDLAAYRGELAHDEWCSTQLDGPGVECDCETQRIGRWLATVDALTDAARYVTESESYRSHIGGVAYVGIEALDHLGAVADATVGPRP